MFFYSLFTDTCSSRIYPCHNTDVSDVRELFSTGPEILYFKGHILENRIYLINKDSD